MAWIESHQELGRHPKTTRLAVRLGISKAAAIGHLHYLWWWALDFAQDGDLSRYQASEIADGAMWEGDPEEFVQALVESGFVDTAPLRLHDWRDYAGRLIEKRQNDAERLRRWRRQRSERDASEPSDSVRNAYETRNTLVTNAVTVPNLTVPNRTGPDHTYAESGCQDGIPEKKARKNARSRASPQAATHSPSRELWSAFVDATGVQPTPGERGKWNAGIKLLLESGIGATDIPPLVARYQEHFPGLPCNPRSVASNLGFLLARSPPRPAPGRAVDRSEYAGDLDAYAELARRKAEEGKVATE